MKKQPDFKLISCGGAAILTVEQACGMNLKES